MLFIRKSTFDDVSLILFAKEWKHESRKIVQKRFGVVERATTVKRNSLSTRSQIIKVGTQSRCARFLWRNFELVLFGGCLIEVKWALKFLDYTYCKNLVSFLSLEETLVFFKFSFFFNFSKQPRKTPVRITNFIFFCLANLGCRSTYLSDSQEKTEKKTLGYFQFTWIGPWKGGC